MEDVAEFLGRHPPFCDLEPAELEALSNRVEVEYFPAGTTIFRRREEPLPHVRIIRAGTVELLDAGRVLDVLGEAELFGHPSMLSGLPTGFEARAGEDLLCYRLPAEAVVALAARPEGSAWLTDVDPTHRPVKTLIRERPVVCEPTATVRDAATAMTAAGASSALIRLGGGRFGILTDRDLRARVVADGAAIDAPVTAVMSEPTYSAHPDSVGTEVMLEMLDRGYQHVPVITVEGEAAGVLTDVDLLTVETRTPFWLRRAIDRATGTEDLERIAEQLNATVITLQDAETAPTQTSAIISIVADALTRRLIELTIDELGEPPCALAWLALGSLGRREMVPSSDLDTAIAWDGDDEDPELQRYVKALAGRVADGLGALGFVADAHGASAAQALFERSADAWRATIRECLERPGEEKALILISLVYDGRTSYRYGNPQDILDEFRRARGRRGLLRLLMRLALVHRPPTGFMRFRDPPRDVVVEHSGEHRGRFDIKEGGMLPIASIARYAGLAAGAVTEPTRARLRAAAEAGTLKADEARALEEAYDLFWGLRLEHQVEQMRRGSEPDNFIDPMALNPLTRSYLREAFHSVRGVQHALGGELTFG